jgi:hypothetical protein
MWPPLHVGSRVGCGAAGTSGKPAHRVFPDRPGKNLPIGESKAKRSTYYKFKIRVTARCAGIRVTSGLEMQD